jgi:hypothetical protein
MILSYDVVKKMAEGPPFEPQAKTASFDDGIIASCHVAVKASSNRKGPAQELDPW